MDKKLQVFVSSTFIDLQEERQVAVEAILNAGHIPAGMELFKAGDESQKETIKRWIDESDAYMVILGGRYGSIDESTGKSYTHWEYDYAGEKGIPRFAIVIDDDALEDKIKTNGSDVMEKENPQKLKEFKELVLSKHSKFFSDIKDIKLFVFESLKEFERDESLRGWISGEKVGDYEELLEENRELFKENNQLNRLNEKMQEKLDKENEIDGYSFEDIEKYLHSVEVKIPDDYTPTHLSGMSLPLLSLFISYKDKLAIGVTNTSNMNVVNKLIFFKMSPKLLTFNLVEKVKIAGRPNQRIQLSKHGNRFIAMYEMRKIKSKA